VGESLAPSILSLLELLGLRQEFLDAGFDQPGHAIVHWGGKKEIVESDGFVIDRSRFDQLLLAKSRNAGVRVLQPASAEKPVRRENGDWLIPVVADRRRFFVAARFLVDAAGRCGSIGGKRVRLSAPTLALSGHWTGSRGGRSLRIEAGERHWYWGASRPDRTFDATLFVDPGDCREHWGVGAVREFYLERIAKSVLLRKCLHGAIPLNLGSFASNASRASDPVSHHHVKVGEALLAVDPLSAQGVVLAISSGLQAAIVVHTLLSSSASNGGDPAAAIEFYCQRSAEAAARQQKLAATEYAREAEVRHTSFWTERAAVAGVIRGPAASPNEVSATMSLERRVSLASEAAVRRVACVRDEVVAWMGAVVHPTMDRPVAYFDGVELAPLLEIVKSLPQPPTMGAVLHAWSAKVPDHVKRRLAEWLVRHGIMIMG